MANRSALAKKGNRLGRRIDRPINNAQYPDKILGNPNPKETPRRTATTDHIKGNGFKHHN